MVKQEILNKLAKLEEAQSLDNKKLVELLKVANDFKNIKKQASKEDLDKKNEPDTSLKNPQENRQDLKAKRLQEIFDKLPDNDLNYWKNFYTKDLDSKSEYLQKRAERLLTLIEEAEELLSGTETKKAAPEQSSAAEDLPIKISEEKHVEPGETVVEEKEIGPEKETDEAQKITEMRKQMDEIFAKIDEAKQEVADQEKTENDKKYVPQKPEEGELRYEKVYTQAKEDPRGDTDYTPSDDYEKYQKEKTRNLTRGISKLVRGIFGSGLKNEERAFKTEDKAAPQKIEAPEIPMETQTVLEKKQEQLLIAGLSPEEKLIAEEEMKTSVPMKFEPEETKTNLGLFLRNQIVKSVSGFRISEKMQKITKGVKYKALLGVGILTLWSNTSSKDGAVNYMKPNEDTGKISFLQKEQINKIISKKTLENVDFKTYNQLPESVRKIYLYSVSNIDSSYIIIDKPSASMFIIGKDKKLIASMPVLLGKARGEAENMSDPNSDLPGPHATTPAGKYTIGHNYASESDIIEYKGKTLTLYETVTPEKHLAIHITYPGEFVKRTAALNTETARDNRMSWGCINVSEENFDKYISNNISGETVLFITPDDPSMALNPSTGKLEKTKATTQFAQSVSGKEIGKYL